MLGTKGGVLRTRTLPYRRRAVIAVARAPLVLRSSRQLSREAIHQGALQKRSEFASLLRLLRSRPPRVVVEIGTAAGGTLYGFCQVAAEDALLVSIDLSGGDFTGELGEDLIPRLRSFARKGQSLHFLRSDSHEASTKAQLVEILKGRPVDFLFIDGDHTYDGVKTDFQMYAPLVDRKGLIGFHDVLDHPRVPSCEVDRFWAEVKARWPYHEYLEPSGGPKSEEWGGIGVLEWPGDASLSPV